MGMAEIVRLRGLAQDFVDDAKSAAPFSLLSVVGSSMLNRPGNLGGSNA
jgi:hypothetical protein